MFAFAKALFLVYHSSQMIGYNKGIFNAVRLLGLVFGAALLGLSLSACDQGPSVEERVAGAKSRHDGPAIWTRPIELP